MYMNRFLDLQQQITEIRPMSLRPICNWRRNNLDAELL